MARSPRFPLHLPLQYRTSQSPGWRQGTTENMSHSGVLFWAENPLDVNTLVEIRVILPVPEPDSSHPEIICQGRVARIVAPTEIQVEPGVAVAIDTYNFLRPPT